MQSSESLGVLTLIFPSAPVVQGWTTACDWLEAPLLGHSPCHRFIESCPQGVLRTIRVVIQPESSGWVTVGLESWTKGDVRDLVQWLTSQMRLEQQRQQHQHQTATTTTTTSNNIKQEHQQNKHKHKSLLSVTTTFFWLWPVVLLRWLRFCGGKVCVS